MPFYATLFSFITLFSHFNISNKTTAAAKTNPKLRKKKFSFCGIVSQSEESMPESLFPTEIAKKNPPIIKAVILGGESFETSDNPIGERHNSPIVITP